MSLETDNLSLPASLTSSSPWEAALSASPSPSSGLLSSTDSESESAIQLAPEVEVGNVEYKLKLLSPTAERFTRLVTQLKWRLLAGSGQALYEIGVSDAGQLIGLSRQDLDDSLNTLERMAGELGATLIIQKEITLPPAPHNSGPPKPLPPSAPTHQRPRIAPSLSRVSPFLADSEPSSSSDRDIPTSLRPTSTPNHGQPKYPSILLSAMIPNRDRSSPKPIIRDYPYGFNAWSHSRSTSSTHLEGPSSPPVVARSLPAFEEVDSDVDDDAAFAFDLDIGNFSSRASSAAAREKEREASSPTRTIILSANTSPTVPSHHDHPPSHAHNHTHRLHRQPKQKKPKMLLPPTLDPVEKALRRRERRELGRENSKTRVRASDIDAGAGVGKAGNGQEDRAVDGLKAINAAEDGNAHAGQGETSSSGSLGGGLSRSQPSSRGDGGSLNAHALWQQDQDLPRYIAEALIVRKFTVEVEEAYLGRELDNLSL